MCYWLGSSEFHSAQLSSWLYSTSSTRWHLGIFLLFACWAEPAEVSKTSLRSVSIDSLLELATSGYSRNCSFWHLLHFQALGYPVFFFVSPSGKCWTWQHSLLRHSLLQVASFKWNKLGNLKTWSLIPLIYIFAFVRTQVFTAENTELFQIYKNAYLLSDGELDDDGYHFHVSGILCECIVWLSNYPMISYYFLWNRPTFIEMFNLWWSILTTLPHLEWPMCPRGRGLTNSTWQQQCANKMGQLVTNYGDVAHICAYTICQVKENWVFFLVFFNDQF